MKSKRTKAGRRASRRNYCVNLAADVMKRERARRHHAAAMREARRSMIRSVVAGGALAIGVAIFGAAIHRLLGARR